MVTVNISNEERESLLCSAMEGGSNYWYWIGKSANAIIDSVAPSNGKTPFVTRIWAAIVAGKSIPVHDIETKRKLGEISLASIEAGEQLMAAKHVRHFADIISEKADACTGDVWFQLAIMQKIKYG